MNRHLTVILYADVVGYSRLTAMNEARTHRQPGFGLNLLGSKISEQGGNKVHEAGDAILTDFTSATAAVETAVLFQKLLAEHESQAPEDESILFRIGINIGEMIRDRDDIYGDGVNIAARIQDVAPPGGLCVSGVFLNSCRRSWSLAMRHPGRVARVEARARQLPGHSHRYSRQS